MDISTEIAAIQAASEGSELRQPIVDALTTLNSGTLPTVTASDAGKILKVGANGWEVGEKSGYMPVPSASLNISTNDTYDVTNYAEAVVNVSDSGGGSVLVSKTITQNGTYDPTDDNADGYSEVIVNVPSTSVSIPQNLIDFATSSNKSSIGLSYIISTGKIEHNGVEYAASLYLNTNMIQSLGIVLLADISAGANTATLSHSINDYDVIILQGIYNRDKSSGYNTTMAYADVVLNKSYWAGMKDRNNSYTCNVTFTDDTHVSLTGNKQVLIYGMPKP